MNKEKQIEENELQEFVITLSDCQHRYDKECTKAIVTKTDMPKANKFYAKYLMERGYHKQSEVELRVETTTDDFKDLEVAKERGYHRKKFYCPNCDLLIKIETWDSERMFGNSTILKSNEMPKFCPNCGVKMKGGAE